MELKIGQKFERFYVQHNPHNGKLEIRGFVDDYVIVRFEDNTIEPIPKNEFLNDIGIKCITLIYDPSIKMVAFNEKALKKFEFISGAGFIRDFPNTLPNGEWIGAVLDFIGEIEKGAN